MFKRLTISVMSVTIVMSSCADSSKTVTTEKVSYGDPLLDKYASGYSYGKSGDVTKSQSDKASEYAGKQFGGNSEFASKDYSTSEYASNRWGGNTKYDSKKYAGNTDASHFQKSPTFIQDQATNLSKTSAAQGSSFATSSFATGAARETSSTSIGKSTSNYAQRDNLDDPLILPWKSQSSFSIGQTKSMMGNDDN